MRRASLIWWLTLALCTCAPPDEVIGIERRAIVGGQPAPDEDAVYLLRTMDEDGGASLCSATLIAPRTLLTAAHCVDLAMTAPLMASNADDVALFAAENSALVEEIRLHPDWSRRQLRHDLALLRLATAQTATPLAWNSVDLAGRGGQPVRALGYGLDALDGGTGTRHEVALTLRQISTEQILIGDLVSKGICRGDSGGPTLHTFDDGVERVIGVHSFTRTDDCNDGADARVDTATRFVREWLAEKEARCDGDGLCSSTACAATDPDCVAVGASCDDALECQGRRCVADTIVVQPYCSNACVGDGDCPSGLGCDVVQRVCLFHPQRAVPSGNSCQPGADVCVEGHTCAGAPARCLKTCDDDTGCPAGATCSQRVCVAPPAELPHLDEVRLPVAGCATADALWPLLVVALLRRRRLRPS